MGKFVGCEKSKGADVRTLWKLLLVLSIALLCRLSLGDENLEQSPEWIEIHGNNVFTTAQHQDADRRLSSVMKDLKQGDAIAMAERANVAIRGIIKIAVKNMRRKGFKADADQVERDWNAIDGDLPRIVKSGSRNIMDFDPWSKRLGAIYILIELKLTYRFCYVSRISDLATFLWTPVVIFGDSCKYGRTEYMLHFAGGDPKYRPFLSCLAYWLTVIPCDIATWGSGIVFPICSPLGMLVEMGANRIAPTVGKKLYDGKCGGKSK